MNDLRLKDFKPRSRLVVKETPVDGPRFPVVDAHNHLGEQFGIGWINKPVQELLDVMDASRVERIIDLDGGWGEEILESHLDHFKAQAPERFAVFGGVDFSRWAEHGDRFGEWAAARLREQVKRGAQGLKLWKILGLSVKDQNDQLVAVDDPRLDPVWSTAADLNIPILIHVADPVAFFDPLDNYNERWEELGENPDWHFPSPPFPSFISVVEGLRQVVLRHPQTTFIGAHVGCYPENLKWVGDLMDEAPNFNVDIAARIAELGRQPYTARKFFLQHPDRILFGTDLNPKPDLYKVHYRFLETDDEYFSYTTEETPGQGRWNIFGLYLPDEVLEQVYNGNARRLVPNR
jgi:predicted TIM-barrel fold metal-dependent hydrolase